MKFGTMTNWTILNKMTLSKFSN